VDGGRPFGGQAVIEFGSEHDRRNFLRWAGILGVGGTLAVLSPRHLASAQNDNGDVDILNFALTLEYLEADFYQRGLEADLLSGRELELIEAIHQHETAHVEAISSTVGDLGATPAEEPSFTYPNETFSDRKAFLGAAFEFETLAVKAYHGQVTRISDGGLLAAAASIAGTESRHAAILADLTVNDPFPRPLEVQASMNKVLQAARPFIEG
jgi:hypothetical protein